MALRYIPRQQQRQPERPHPMAAPVNDFLKSLMYMMALQDKNKTAKDKLSFDKEKGAFDMKIAQAEEGRAAFQHGEEYGLPAQPGQPYEEFTPSGGQAPPWMTGLNQQPDPFQAPQGQLPGGLGGPRLPGNGPRRPRLRPGQTLEEMKAYRTPGTPATQGFKQREAESRISKNKELAEAARLRGESYGIEEPEEPYKDPLANPYITKFQTAATNPAVQAVPGQLESMVPQLQEYLKGTNRYLDAPRTVKPQGWWDKNISGNAPELEYSRPPVVRSRRDRPPSILKPTGGAAQAPAGTQTPVGTQGRTVEKKTKDGRIAIFDAITHQFIRYK